MEEPTYTFEAALQVQASGGSYLLVPASVSEALGIRGLVRVRGTLAGQPFQSSLSPLGGGQHMLLVHKATRTALCLQPGATVAVAFARDLAERTVDVPAALAEALAAAPAASATFAALAYTHRKEFARWVAEAKKPETRQRRVAQAIAMLLAGRTIS